MGDAGEICLRDAFLRITSGPGRWGSVVGALPCNQRVLGSSLVQEWAHPTLGPEACDPIPRMDPWSGCDKGNQSILTVSLSLSLSNRTDENVLE